MARRRRPYRAISRVDPKALAEFQAGIRKRYSDEEILGQLKACAERLGRSPTMREFSEDTVTGIHPQTVIERAIQQGAALARRLRHLPRFADWADARRADPALLSEWQVYRMFDARRGAWAMFQFLVRERLIEQGVRVGSDGSLHR